MANVIRFIGYLSKDNGSFKVRIPRRYLERYLKELRKMYEESIPVIVEVKPLEK